jgi:aminoglycoside phosphotransferase (APT) family kinase protein
VGNLLTTDGRLSAVIDFGTCGVGDPACDLVIAWTFFDAPERQVFRDAVGLADDAWSRARGWALWKALVTVVDPEDPQYDVQARALKRLLDDATGH